MKIGDTVKKRIDSELTTLSSGLFYDHYIKKVENGPWMKVMVMCDKIKDMNNSTGELVI